MGQPGVKQLVIAQWLLTVPLVVFFLLHVVVVPLHIQDPWPPHARHHALRAAFLGAALAILGLWLVWYPLRERRRSAWWLLAVVGIAAYGGFWASTARRLPTGRARSLGFVRARARAVVDLRSGSPPVASGPCRSA